MRTRFAVVVLLALVVGIMFVVPANAQDTVIGGSGWAMSIPGITVKHSEKVPTAFVNITWPMATFDGPAGGTVVLPAGEAFREFDKTEVRVDLSGYYEDQKVKADGKPMEFNCMTLDTTRGARVVLGWDGRAKDHAKLLGLIGNIAISDDIIPIREMIRVVRQDRESDYRRMLYVARSRYPHADAADHQLYAKAYVLAKYANLVLTTLDSYECIEATMAEQERQWQVKQEEERRAAAQAAAVAEPANPSTMSAPPPAAAPSPTIEPAVTPKPDPWAKVLSELESFDSNGFLFVAVDAKQAPTTDEFSLVLWKYQGGKWMMSRSSQGEGPEVLRLTQGRGQWCFGTPNPYETAGWQGFGFSCSASTPPTHAPIRFGEKARIIAVTKEAETYEVQR